jgi:hypothetical protein
VNLLNTDVKLAVLDGGDPKRDYASPIKVYGKEYFLCSKWFESPIIMRPYLMKRLAPL